MDFVLSFVSSGIGAALVAFLGKDWLAARLRAEIEKDLMSQRARFDLKLAACLEALSVVDARFSNVKWIQDGAEVPVVSQALSIEKARNSYNKLCLTCESPEVIKCYANALGLREPDQMPFQVNAADIQELRNMMRKELGFGRGVELLDGRAWIAHLDGLNGS